MTERYYKPRDITHMYNLGLVTVYKWIADGRLRAVKLGGVWRIPESALQEFIHHNTDTQPEHTPACDTVVVEGVNNGHS